MHITCISRACHVHGCCSCSCGGAVGGLQPLWAPLFHTLGLGLALTSALTFAFALILIFALTPALPPPSPPPSTPPSRYSPIYIYIHIRTAGRAPSARGSRSTACSEISISSTTQSRTRAARRSPPGCATTARCERWLSSTTGCRAPWARRCGQRSRCGSVVKVPRLAAPQLGSCASSGRAWRPLAALGSLVRPGRRRPTGRPATASGARASHLQRLSRRLHRL